MKKLGVKLISVTLAFTMIVSGFAAVGASAASDIGDSLTHVGVKALEVIIRSVLTGVCAVIPDDASFQKLENRVTENFYSGTEELLKEPADNACWSLGYAKASLVPEALKNGDFSGEYYLGGYMTLAGDNYMSNNVTEVIDDMQIRVIAVSDNSGRGISVFANVDCIGFCNGDIREVRNLVKELLPDVDFNSINITSTHCHSCIDTQGLWTDGFKKILLNIAKSYVPFLEKTRGVNMEWMDWAKGVMADAIKNAVGDMTEGSMTYAVKTLDKDYFNNKNRKSSTSLNSDMSRFIFTPSDESKKPTMLVNINAHPDVAGLAVDKVDNGKQISGDYVYYLGEKIEQNGYNFMFINGAIAGIYFGRGLSNDNIDTDRRYEQCVRYGYEMAEIALNLENSYEEVKAKYEPEVEAEMQKQIERHKDDEGYVYDESGYTRWYEKREYTKDENGKIVSYEITEKWTPVEAVDVKPLLNIRIKEVPIHVTNPLMILVAKLGLCNYTAYKDGLTKYYMVSEAGIAQFGQINVAMMPGEIVQDLVYGGKSLTAEGSFKGKDFPYPCVREMLTEDTICFGLCNDACGYVVPDNDYSLGIVDDHYQELISLGDETASAVMEVIQEIIEEYKA